MLTTGRQLVHSEDRTKVFTIAMPRRLVKEINSLCGENKITRSYWLRLLAEREIERHNNEKKLQGLQNQGANQHLASQAAGRRVVAASLPSGHQSAGGSSH